MTVAEILPIILYILGTILLVVLIILGLRLIQVLDKVDSLLSNIEDKVNSLNNIFNVINKTTTSIDYISARVVNGVISVFDKLFRRKKRKDDYYE